MIEITGDIRDSDTWSKTLPCDKDLHLCVTTNGYILERTGKVAMGAGVAKLFRDTHRGIDEALAHAVKRWGNIPQFLWDGDGYDIYSFPTKYRWNEYSDIEIITRSARIVKAYSNKGNAIWVIPKPGCGCGGLDWLDVKEVLAPILDTDNFWIIDNK